jgi:hypothetical protein
MDVAGVIEDVGPGVTGFAAGDEVYGLIGGVGSLPGTQAQDVIADARLLAHKPTNLTMREAAVLPLVTITAWEGLIDRAAIRPGDKVLVQGGAGGVGHVAVQIALARGARVFAPPPLSPTMITCLVWAPCRSTLRGMWRTMLPNTPKDAASTWCMTPAAGRCSMPRSRRCGASAMW